MVLFANPTAVVISTCMVVGSWGCPSSSRVVRIGKACLAFRKVAPISASAAEDQAMMAWGVMFGVVVPKVGAYGGPVNL